MGLYENLMKEASADNNKTPSLYDNLMKEIETEELAKQKGTTVDGLERAKYVNQENARKEQRFKELNAVKVKTPEQEADTAIQKIKDKPWYVPKGVAVSIENVKLSPKARKIYADKSEEKKSKSANRAVGNKFLDSVSWGAIPAVKKYTHEKSGIGTDKFIKQEEENNANHPVASTIGTAAGYLLPGAGVEKLAGKALKPLLGKVGSKVAQKAITGAVTGGGMELAEGTIRGQSAKDIAKRTAAGAGFGAVGDVAFYGAGKGISSIANKIKAGKVLTTAEKEIVKNTPELLPKIAKEIEMPSKPIEPSLKPQPKITNQKEWVDSLAKYSADGKNLQPSSLPDRINIPTSTLKQPSLSKLPPIDDMRLKTDLTKPSTQTSQFRTNTLERSTTLPDAVKKDLNPKEFDYIVESSKDWQSQAMKNVADNKEKVMSDIINANSISGGIQAHEVAAITSNLLDEVRKTSDTSTFKSWLKIVTEKTRETARALKGTDTAWDKKTAEGALTDAQRVINKVENGIEKSNPAKIKKINEETARRVKEFTDLGKTVNPDEIRDIVKKEYGVPTLDDSDIKFIIDNMDKAKSLEDGSYEQRVLHAKVAKIIADKIPSSFGEKFQASQRILMLLNTKTTVVRNPLGNALLGTLEDAKNIIATPIDKMVSGIRKSERTTTLSPLLKSKASIDGAKKGLKEWALDIKNGIDTSPTGGQVEMPKNKIFSENHNIGNASIKSVADTGGKVANKVHGVVGKMLQIGDRPFYEAAYGSRIAELKKIRNTDIITDAMKEDAVQYAFERTLQNDSALAQMFTGLKKGSFISDEHSAAKSVYQFMANLVMPFAKTPANILDKFIDYSPVGILKASTVHGLATVGKGTFNQKKFVDTMARGLTGTGLSALGYLMAQKGMITGARDNNNKVEKIETALGKQNYAFKVGDNYYTYDWALPASAPIAMGADIYNAIAKSDGKNAVLKGTESAVNLLFNSTLLQGPSGFTGGYSPAAALGRGLMGTTTQATPTAGKQIAQLIDPYIRETYDPNTFKQTLNKTIARIPFASKTLPAKVDVFGNDVKAFQGKNNVWNVMFNPGFSTTYKPDDVQKEIIRLYSDSGLTEQLPTLADKYIAETKQNPRINLTSDEFVQYQKQIGQLTASRFKEVINSLEYRNGSLSDEIKAKMLGDIVKDSKRQAKNDILVKKGYQAR